MTLTQLNKIKREPVAHKVYAHIKQSILSGDIPPRTRLLEIQIAEQMGVSRSPVREAFRQLETDGLVQIRTNLGATVRELSTEDIQEIYTARSLLEGYAASLAAERATPADIERLQDALKVALEAAQRGDFKATVQADFDLHRQIWNISGHKIVQSILSRLEVQIRMFMAVRAPLYVSLIDTVKGHEAILDAIRSHDAETAKASLERHINEAATLTLSRLKEDAHLPL